MARAVLGNGIYSIGEAARLLGSSPPRVRAWFTGWSDREPWLKSDYEGMFSKSVLSFLDFVDASVAVTLRDRHHVSLGTIRRLRDELSKEWKTPHPFSRGEFYTDDRGRKVFCTIAQENGEVSLREILSKQYAIGEILLPFLKHVKYMKDTQLAYMVYLTDRVTIDPELKCGKPTVIGTGIPTTILNQSYEANDSYEVVADWYNVSVQDVRDAVAFETQFRGLAA